METLFKLVEKLKNKNLSEDENEKKIIQIVDLVRFIEYYKSSIKIEDCLSYDINIVLDNDSLKGILLCDMIKFHNVFSSNYNLTHFKKKLELDELWFVFVLEHDLPYFDEISMFIEEHSIRKHYNKVFIFNFFQGHVNELQLIC